MHRPSLLAKRILLATAILCAALAGPATAEFDLPYVIKAKSIVIAPGEVIEGASLVVVDGVIQDVGVSVDIPKGAKILEFENLTIYPGLIESYSGRSFEEKASDDDDEDALDLGHENDLVQPERDATTATFSEDDAKKLRNAGFTLAVGVPNKGIFRGGAIVQMLGNGTLKDNLMQVGVVQAAGLNQSTSGGYPTSLMGSMALFRQVVADARWHQDAEAKYARDSAQRKPEANVSLAALDGVVSKAQPLLFETGDVTGALRVLALLEQTDLDGLLLGSGSEYQRLDEVVAGGRAIVLPVDFPDAPTIKGVDDATIADGLKPSLGELRHWKAAADNPAKLVGAGATVAFTSHELSSPGDIFPNLAKAIERGLTQEQALAGLTTVPAKLYGLDKIAGTIAKGKMANFLLAEGDLFVEKPKIQEIWVAGSRYELEEIKPPEVDPVGKWTIKVSADGQTIEGVVRIRGTIESLSGSLEVMGMTLPISDVTVSGKTAILTVDTAAVGMPGEMTLRMNIDSDSATGSGDGPMGAFSFTAKRSSSNPDRGADR